MANTKVQSEVQMKPICYDNIFNLGERHGRYQR